MPSTSMLLDRLRALPLTICAEGAAAAHAWQLRWRQLDVVERRPIDFGSLAMLAGHQRRKPVQRQARDSITVEIINSASRQECLGDSLRKQNRSMHSFDP